MDYSLLVGIHHMLNPCESFEISSASDSFILQPVGTSFSNRLKIFEPGASFHDTESYLVDHTEVQRRRDIIEEFYLHDDSGHGSEYIPFFKQDMKGIKVQSSKLIFIGIVDILQTWSLKKRIEHFLKVIFLCRDQHGVSAVPPVQYADRFQRKIITHFKVEHVDQENSILEV